VGLGRRALARRGSVPSSPRVRDTRRTRGFEEGTRCSGTRLRSSARGLRVSNRFTAAARGLLLVALSRKSWSSARVSPPRPRPGDRRRRNRRLALQIKPRASGAGGRAPAEIASSRHCAHVSFVLQKSVGRTLAQRSARRQARGAKPLASASDPRERGPSESCGTHAKARGKRGERRGFGIVGAWRSSSRERQRDRRRLTSARHRKAPPPKGVRRQTELDAILTDGRHLGS